MTAAFNPHEDGSSDTGATFGDHAPMWTRCSIYKVESPPSSGSYSDWWEADIVGDVGGTRVAVVIWSSRPLKDIPGTVSFIFDASIEVYNPSDKYPLRYPRTESRLTVNPDLHSGQVSADISDRPYGPAVLHLTGDWRCR